MEGQRDGRLRRAGISDAWTLTDRFSLTTGDANTTGLVPDGGAVQVGALLADPAVDPRAVVTGPITGAVTGRAIGSGRIHPAVRRLGSPEGCRCLHERHQPDLELRPWNGDVRLLRVERLEQRPLGAGQLRVPGRASREARSSPASPATIRRSTAAASTTTSTSAAMPRPTRCTQRLRSTSPTGCGRTSAFATRNYEIDYTLDEGTGRHHRFRRVGRPVRDLVDGGPQLPVHGPDGRLRAHQPGSPDAAVRRLSGRPRSPRQRQ